MHAFVKSHHVKSVNMIKFSNSFLIFNNLMKVNQHINKINIRLKCNLTSSEKIIEKSVKEKMEQKELIQQNLAIPYNRSATLLRKYPYLKTIDNDKMSSTIKILQKFGMQNEDIYNTPALLAIHANTIEHNITFLKEAGFTEVTGSTFLRFRTIIKKPISLLKAHNIIPEDTNVPKRLMSSFDPNLKLNTDNLFTDEDNIINIHKVLLKKCFEWKFKSSSTAEIDHVMKTYDEYQYKSFALLSKMINLLNNELNFKDSKILQHGYLLQITADSVRNVMREFPTIAGVNIKDIFFKCPKIISTPLRNVTEIHNHLKDFNISEEAIRKCFEIYTLAPETVRFRLNEIKNVPEFDALFNNNRIVRLIFCQNKAKFRLEHLQKLNVKCVSLNILCGSDTVFEKYIQEGNDKTKGCDITNFMSLEFGKNHQEIRKQLLKNPHWYHVPLTNVQNTYRYLLQRHFTKSDISKVPLILLYPRYKVAEAMQELKENPETRDQILLPKTILNVCLYFIERKHHFSCDGMWDNGSKNGKVVEELETGAEAEAETSAAT